MKQIRTEEELSLWSVRLERSNQRRWWDRLAQVYEVYQMVNSQMKEGDVKS